MARYNFYDSAVHFEFYPNKTVHVYGKNSDETVHLSSLRNNFLNGTFFLYNVLNKQKTLRDVVLIIYVLQKLFLTT